MAYILFEGPSQLDHKPIVVIMTKGGKSTNEKTGAMAQVYILRSDVPPLEAAHTGEDSSICGACPHRPSTGGSCYVNIGQGPRAIYEAYKRGRYEHVEHLISLGMGLNIRLGAYGDPAAVPLGILESLVLAAKSWTGYTHQAFNAPWFKRICMASADSEPEAQRLQRLGWKTFRVKMPDDPLMTHEVLCPNQTHGVQCETCKLCNGQKVNVAIDVHGLTHKITKFKNWSTQT